MNIRSGNSNRSIGIVCRSTRLLGLFTVLVALGYAPLHTIAADAPTNFRPPTNDASLKYWLQNMVWYHQFTTEEIHAATGLNSDAIGSALDRFQITAATRPKRKATDDLLVLPYPGGRHPRIGFLDGAIRPQRETKISVFLPWDPASYVVVDVPEAIWSNLGLTYLAHTHIDTVWTKKAVDLKRLEWIRKKNGTLEFQRTLPNGIQFGTRVRPGPDAVRMEMWLINGTKKKLTDLRVQNCVMLKGARGFEQQTDDNKLKAKPFVACRSEKGSQWIITAWEPCHRPWTNPPVPCLHSDPRFPDCAPGETKRLRGWLSFFQGEDINAELKRLQTMDWLNGK